MKFKQGDQVVDKRKGKAWPCMVQGCGPHWVGTFVRYDDLIGLARWVKVQYEGHDCEISCHESDLMSASEWELTQAISPQGGL